MRTKVNGGDARRDILKAYFLARESTTDMSQAPLPFYAASRSCAPRCPARRVVGIGHMERLATWPGPVKISRFLLPQSFVRTLIVIIANPIPSAALLSRYRTGWWVSGVFFEDAVHLLVSRVIFRMAPPTELHFDSQAQPPKTQTRKAQRAHATEGRTVIHANHLRYAITSEQALAAGADGLVTLVVQQEDAQNVTTKKITHRQRFDPLAASTEPTLEIKSPHVVWSFGHGKRADVQQRTAPGSRPSSRCQAQGFEATRDCANTRNVAWGVLLQQYPNLFGSPARMLSPNLPDLSHPMLCHLVGRGSWTTGVILQRRGAPTQKAFYPLITGRAADVKSEDQSRKSLFPRQIRAHELEPLRNQRNTFPCHAGSSGRSQQSVNKVLAQSVNNVLAPCQAPVLPSRPDITECGK